MTDRDVGGPRGGSEPVLGAGEGRRRASEVLERRRFLAWLAGSTCAGSLGFLGCRISDAPTPTPTPGPGGPAALERESVLNVFALEQAAEREMGEDALAYLAGGADDMRTVRANRDRFAAYGIRARRLVDVRSIDTSLALLGDRLASPILLAPVGFQAFFHPDGELATARAARRRQHRMIASCASSFAVGEIARAGGEPVWFQLYPTPNREITRALLQRAEDAGCGVVALTVDTPVIGNRERHSTTLQRLLASGEMTMGNYAGLLNGESINDPSMTWDMVGWLKSNTSMRVVLKGIVTGEDAELAVRHGADGMIVSNHGGRQLESDRATIDCLAEVVAGAGDLPVLLDGGVRRGTDVFKALALGARAVCIGRPYCWGLGAFGQAGVERALELLQAELVRAMQLAGAVSLEGINPSFVTLARAAPAQPRG